MNWLSRHKRTWREGYYERMLLVALIAAMVPLINLAAKGDKDCQARHTIRAMYNTYRLSFLKVPSISAEEYMDMREDDDVVLIDAREDYEREVSIIPGAISAADFEAEADEHAGKRVVVHCAIGYRSGLYAKELLARGFNAYNLEGGILLWAHAGGGLVGADGEGTKLVHVYGRQWDLLPEGYGAVW